MLWDPRSLRPIKQPHISPTSLQPQKPLPAARLKLQKAAQKRLCRTNGEGSNLRWGPGLCLAKLRPVRFAAFARGFAFPVNERLQTRFSRAAFIGLAALGRLPQRASPRPRP